MCWTSNSNNLKTAEKDIKVVKIVKKAKDGSIRPIHFPHEMAYGKKKFLSKEFEINGNGLFHSEIIMEENEGKTECYKALHSYDSNLELLETNKNVLIKPLEYVIESYQKDNIYCMECVIPEGSQYAVNKYGEYVSDTLKVLNFRPIKNYVVKKAC